MMILEHIISFLAPHICIGCGSEGELLCKGCMQLLPRTALRCYRCTNLSPSGRTCTRCRRHSYITNAWSVTPYAGVAKELVGSIKFNRAAAAARTIARTIASVVPVSEGLLITHAPTAPGRARQRGYDQAQLIARHTARFLGVPYASLLVRQGTQRQVGKTRAVRQQQMGTAFRLAPGVSVQNASVLIIDDVITTGATLEAAAAILHHAGAQRIRVAVFAAA